MVVHVEFLLSLDGSPGCRRKLLESHGLRIFQRDSWVRPVSFFGIEYSGRVQLEYSLLPR